MRETLQTLNKTHGVHLFSLPFYFPRTICAKSSQVPAELGDFPELSGGAGLEKEGGEDEQAGETDPDDEGPENTPEIPLPEPRAAIQLWVSSCLCC